jgi:serine/threonine protein phosphatase PrpC
MVPFAVAVADGHGSANSFRSATGAALAVEVAVEALLELVALPLEAPEQTTLEKLAETLVNGWQTRVDADIEQHPFGEQKNTTQVVVTAISKNPRLAYGTTLLGVAVTETYLVVLQLGDGDVVVVDQGKKSGRPIPRDPRLAGNETTSLCDPDAKRLVRWVVIPAIQQPRLVLLATDGYSNSFSSDEGFLQVATDLLVMSASPGGAEEIEREFAGWLDQTSREGSGDDTTAVVLWPV